MNTESSIDEVQIQKAADIIRESLRVVVLTGAGISAESGIPTFRDMNGLWEGHSVEEVATPRGWEKNPHLVWQFYHARRERLCHVQPNPGHYAIARLQELWKSRFTLITQNVDGLHQKSGNHDVLELHGSLYRTRCTTCGEIVTHSLDPLAAMPRCKTCEGLLRPDIVWFNESLPEPIWTKAVEAVNQANVLLVVGTSALVYPAASLIPLVRVHHKSRHHNPFGKAIEINLKSTEMSPEVDLGLYGPAGVILPKLVEYIEKKV